MNTPTARFACAATLAVLTGCDEDVVGPYVAADTVGEVRVALGSDPSRWRADAMSVTSAHIEGDLLHVDVTHGGGCAPHGYAAVAWNGWLESHPVQVGTLLAHNGHDDPCDALISAHLRFDLTPLKEAYRRSYGTASAVLILNLDTTAPNGSELRAVEYAF
ncbi:MAG: hypothetical protein WEG36_16310 [Gemmatimonadota bacterium]